jgi:hypothetical protein
MIPTGGMLIVAGLRGDGMMPQGVWQGSMIIILGLALIVISVRQLLMGDKL